MLELEADEDPARKRAFTAMMAAVMNAIACKCIHLYLLIYRISNLQVGLAKYWISQMPPVPQRPLRRNRTLRSLRPRTPPPARSLYARTALLRRGKKRNRSNNNSNNNGSNNNGNHAVRAPKLQKL